MIYKHKFQKPRLGLAKEFTVFPLFSLNLNDGNIERG
jgi:hypothetical protein